MNVLQSADSVQQCASTSVLCRAIACISGF